MQGAFKIEKKGLIFNIQRYSIHDGPGIRTVVFFKGCPLRCVWCSNPESQSCNPEVFFSPLKCIGCGECVKLCKNKAIITVENEIKYNRNACVCCGGCIENCPTGARIIAGKEMSAAEILKEVEKDYQFYRRSDGGTTISGGEPVLQSEFLKELVCALKTRNIHVAIETSGYAPWDQFWDGVKDADLILYDLKAFDSVLHRQITEVGNEEILDNAKKISSLKKVIFRIPVIPGYNNFESSFKGLADFINRCNPGGEVHIIPYHALGKPKYKRLGLEYELSDVVPPSDEDLKVFAKIFSEKGLDTKIY